jgi:penicillin-binding protein 2
MHSLASAQERNNFGGWILRGMIFLVGAILFARLAELQIIKGQYYRDLSEANRLRRVPIVAARGKILARGGEELVGNKEVKKEIIVSAEGGIEKKKSTSTTSSVNEISEWEREYKLGNKFSHVSGYISEVNEEELGKVNAGCTEKGELKLGTWVGRSGLEDYYDCQIRGVDGEELIEVDTFGNKIRTWGRQNPKPGEDLVTTVDFGFTQKLASLMEGKRGAAIITDTKGEVLALASTPSFDPMDVTAGINSEELPLLNRAIGGAYHPGSVFKMVTAFGALEAGKIDKEYEYDDTGVVVAGETSYTNWYFTQYGSTEGMVDLTRALARSTDTFFYEVGGLMGPDVLSDWAKKFKLDQKSGIELPGEIVGLVPSPEWKKAVKGERWYLGNTYHMSIGQGDLALTPVAVHRIVMSIANNGVICDLKIAINKDGKCEKLGISQQNLDIVKEGMRKACSNGGTAYPFFDFYIPVICKTGTAETMKEDVTHAWFSIAAPADNPEVVMTVLVEEGGEGSKVAAPIAREMLNFWYARKNP